MLVVLKYLPTFAPQLRGNMSLKIIAQMAESVDALVSNTSGVTSIPVRPRVWVPGKELSRMSNQMLGSFLFSSSFFAVSSFSVLERRNPCHLDEEFAEDRLVGKAEVIGYLLYSHIRAFEQAFRFCAE